MTIDFISFKDFVEIRTMHTKSNNIEIIMVNETNFLQRYQEGLEEKLRESEFVFDSVFLLHYNLHKISLNRGGSCIDSPK